MEVEDEPQPYDWSGILDAKWVSWPEEPEGDWILLVEDLFGNRGWTLQSVLLHGKRHSFFLDCEVLWGLPPVISLQQIIEDCHSWEAPNVTRCFDWSPTPPPPWVNAVRFSGEVTNGGVPYWVWLWDVLPDWNPNNGPLPPWRAGRPTLEPAPQQ